MLKDGPTDIIPGKSSPGSLTSKSLTSGVWKVPLALALTLKIAETFPENPAVKAYAKKLCSGTVDVSYGGSTYQLHNILGDN